MSKKLFNHKKPIFWIILGIIFAAVIITLIIVNHFNSFDMGVIGGADGPTSIIISKPTDNPTFEATVIEVHKGFIIVKPDPESDAAKSANKIHVPLDTVDEEIRSQLNTGTQIMIEYDGALQETYPAEISVLYNIIILP